MSKKPNSDIKTMIIDPYPWITTITAPSAVCYGPGQDIKSDVFDTVTLEAGACGNGKYMNDVMVSNLGPG